MVVASGAILEVVEVAIVVVLVFLVAVDCYGCLWVVVDGGSGLLRLMVAVSYGLLYLFY